MSAPAEFSIKVADADATVAAIAAGDEPPVRGRISGERPRYRQALDATVVVLDRMAVHTDDSSRVVARVHGQGEGHTTPWTAPSAAAVLLRAVASDIDLHATRS